MFDVFEKGSRPQCADKKSVELSLHAPKGKASRMLSRLSERGDADTTSGVNFTKIQTEVLRWQTLNRTFKF